MRRMAGIVFVIAGLWAWFGPWQASMPTDAVGNAPATVQVACAPAPVDLFQHGSDPLGANGWFGDAPVAGPPASEACRASAWWRTILGTLALGVGMGWALRDRTRTAIERLHGADVRPLGA